MLKLAHVVLAAVFALSFAACRDRSKERAKPAPGKADVPTATTTLPKSKNKRQIPPPPDVGAIPADAKKSASGLAFKLLQSSDKSEHPGPNDTVLVHYTGWKSTGEMYISTTTRGVPQSMSLAQAPTGWGEALRMMTVGEKRRLWMPARLAFANSNNKNKDDLMVYEVELLEIKAAPTTPADLAGPPPGTATTKAGIAYRTLSAGKDTTTAKEWDEVTINFSGWTRDGRLIASSVVSDKPQTFALYRKGQWWPEVIGTMSAGQKSRFWIPGELSTRPRERRLGDLVFDIELISIKAQNPPPPVPENLTAPADAKKTASGIPYEILASGKGKTKPVAQSLVKVNFTVWTESGALQDSSIIRGEPGDFAMNRLPVPLWAKVLEEMVVGDRWRVWVSGDKMPQRGRKAKPEGFIFEFELIEINQRPKPPAAPKDVAKPPASAKKTDKGVFYVVLEPGKGSAHPQPTDRVAVNYTGWSTDGKMFDSSIPSAQPSKFRLNGVIKGWTDGLQTMVVGDKTRFWIPEALAYKDQPGRPQGMLVFDVELLEIIASPKRPKRPKRPKQPKRRP